VAPSLPHALWIQRMLMSPSKCGHCSSGGADCRGLRHRRLCELTDPDHPDYNPRYLNSLQAPPPSKAHRSPCQESQPGKMGVSEHIDLIRSMKACPSWEKSSDCGCGNNRCREGKGREGVVSHQDCFECLRSEEEVPQTPSPDEATQEPSPPVSTTKPPANSRTAATILSIPVSP
jgi:hypothetical protein